MSIRTAKKPIIVIVGPTSAGKSDAAVLLAKKIDGAVVSADSRQVYRGMNIGSGKITKKEMRGIPHFCLDLISPKTTFTATHFIRHAMRALKKIDSSGKIPIICGGTGFYIDILLGRMPTAAVPPDALLRKKLEKKDIESLLRMLHRLNPARASSIDRFNKVRLMRAIEIARYEKSHRDTATTYHNALSHKYIIWLGIKKEKAELDVLIEKRLKKRWARILQETKKLHASGVSWKRLYDLGLEYRYSSLALQKKLNKDVARTELLKAIKKYAKRQMTWFKRNKNIQWVPDAKLAAALGARNI